MLYCTACQKAPATIDIKDLAQGVVTSHQHLCAACAENIGIVQKQPMKVSPEIFEELLGGLKGKTGRDVPRRRDPVCAGCGMTMAEFRAKGRLGCPRCYDAFRTELLALLQRVHEAVTHRGRLPGRLPQAPPPAADQLADLRRRLEEAIRGERYEEAARLRDELRRAEKGGAGARS